MNEIEAPAAVYVQSNEAGENRVVAYSRAGNGALSEAGSYTTGGAGNGVPHLTSQGSVVLTGDRRRLLVTNAGSRDVSLFDVSSGPPALVETVETGAAPKSVAEHDSLVYVLSTGAPSIVGFRLSDVGLEPLQDSERGLASGSDPAQIGFTPDGSALVVTERGVNAIVVYSVDDSGHLGEGTEQPFSGPTPYGFAFTRGGTLVVTEAFRAEVGRAAASSYVARGGSLTPISRSAGNGRSEISWAVVTGDGR